MSITIKTSEEIERMRTACRLAAAGVPIETALRKLAGRAA